MALDPKRMAEVEAILAAKRTPEWKARLARMLDRSESLKIIDPLTGEPIPDPCDCGDEMNIWLDYLITRYRATRNST
jgi:hypothetical protein